MSRRLIRTAALCTAVLAGAAGVAYGTSSFASSTQATSVIQACENPGNGNLRVVANAATDCHANETALTWNVVGPQGPQGLPGPKGDTGDTGPAGNFTGVFRSPNGDYSLTVSDTGIELRGPNGRVTLNDGGIDVKSALNLTLEGGTDALVKSGTSLTLNGGTDTSVEAGGNLELSGAGTADLKSGAITSVDGPLVELNGCSAPIPLVGGLVDLSGVISMPPGTPVAGNGTISAPGALTVCAG